MGIPRLLQDLLPYAERAVLGNVPADDESLKITCLVIDGPSLVYYVYNKLLAHHVSLSPSSSLAPPSYADINAAVVQVLSDFESYDVDMSAMPNHLLRLLLTSIV